MKRRTKKRRAPWVRRIGLFILIASLALVIGRMAGCFDRVGDDSGPVPEIQPTAPEAVLPPEHVERRLESTLHVPIEVPVSEIAALVNKVIPDSLYHVRDMKIRGGIFGIKLDLDLVRDGEIETYTAFGSVFNSLPLAARGRVRIPPGVWRPFESTFVINATTDLTLDEQWNTRSSTHTVMTWGEEPFITIAGIKFSLRGASEDAMNEQLAKLTPEIDRMIEREVNLRKEVEKVWDDLTEPIPIRDEPPMWVSIFPEKIFYTPPESKGDTVVVDLWVGAAVETVVGDRPESLPASDLPPLHRLPDSLGVDSTYGFTIHLPISVTYEDARSIVARSLEGRRIEVQKQVVVELRDIALYGNGQSLIAQVDFSANLGETSVGTNGRIYFTGLPTYDPVEQVIRVDSFDYDIESRNALTEAAGWVLKEGFLEETREQLRFSIGGEILLAREQLAEALKYRPIGKHIVLSGTLDDLRPGEIYLVDDGITVDIFATGRLEVRIRDLDAAVKKVPKLVE